MIVVDASAMVDIITGQRRAAELSAVVTFASRCVVPEHFLLEVTSGLRGAWLTGRIDRAGFAVAMDRLATFRTVTWPVGSLLPRIVELAANATPYDAAYVAVAERLDAPLVTADDKLTRMPGVRCRFLPDPPSGPRGASPPQP
jgi:predicted nucleic acid-binding protein